MKASSGIEMIVQLERGSGESLRAPCFLLGERLALLPAFGSFTGMAEVRRGPGDRIFLVGPNEVTAI